nr:sn1-specific diacylglycerol lipase alpha [Ciona intestinalis]|eukprot:XP_026696611.1 sn1-specific diacylglycerol lipase alpha [Ciona intestinalis]
MNSLNTHNALDEAADIFHEFFRDLDLVPSDILAGLILLRKEQKVARKLRTLHKSDSIEEYLCEYPVSDQSLFLNLTNQVELDVYHDQMYYCNYAIASYGPLFYYIYNPLTGVCKMTQSCMCGHNGCCLSNQSSHYPLTYGDHCFNCKTNVVQLSLDDSGYIQDTEIVYISWNNDVYQQPFFVAIDHNKRSVVLTIRGTLSELDALTDAVASPISIPVEGNDGTWKGHKGIVSCASYIQAKLVEDEILSQVFHSSCKSVNYKFILVGHSLGAGVAAILSIMLHPTYPQLECYCYAPPGGLLSFSAMESSKVYIQTAVLGNDVVIRTGLPQLEVLRNKITNLLKKTQLPKYRIILGNIFHCGKDSSADLSQHIEMSNITEKFNETGEGSNSAEKLYPPGKILHVIYRKQEDQSSWFNSRKESVEYYALHADNANHFNEIIVSGNMISHHFPQELLKALEKVQSYRTKTSDKYSQAATLESHAPLIPTRINNLHVTDQRLWDEGPSCSTNETNQNFSSNTQQSTFAHSSVHNTDNETFASNDHVMQQQEQVDPVLLEFDDQNNEKETLDVKYFRSQSMPPHHKQQVDEETFFRARFEPNLIPKPPRSHSFQFSHKVQQ